MQATSDRPHVSIVIPLYNETRVVAELCRRLHAVLREAAAGYDVILVDDGSRDDTWKCIQAEHAKDPHVKGVRLSRNFGHQVALSAGLDHATGEVIVMMDGDLQDPPELIPELLEQWRQGGEVVYATKRSRREAPLKRAAFRAFHVTMHRVADIEFPEGAGNFSLMSARVVAALRGMPERARYLSGLRAWVGFRQIGVEFDRDARYDEKPRMRLSRLMTLALDAIFGFSRLPLRIALYVGVATSTVSLGVAVWVLYQRFFTDHAIAGWASILVSIYFVGGAILIIQAVIGEYIGRIYDEVKQRPLYLVREMVGLDDSS
jgi:dolichol-phosphate mannosyltransferase